MAMQYRIALYMRLSKEDDGEKEESNSIATQRLLLRSYVKRRFGEESGKLTVREYVDV